MAQRELQPRVEEHAGSPGREKAAASPSLPPGLTTWLSLAQGPVLVFQPDDDGMPKAVAAANQAAAVLLGRSATELVGVSPADLIENHLEINAHCRRLRPEGVRELGLVLRDGRGGRAACTARLGLVAPESGGLLALSLSPRGSLDFADMTCTVMKGALEGFALLDAQGTVRQVNPAFSGITGYASDEVEGKSLEFLYSALPNGPDFFQRLWGELVDEGAYGGEVWSQRKDGEVYCQWLSLTSLTDPAGRVGGYTAMFQDMGGGDGRGRNAPISRYDVLTGLPNRGLLLDRLSEALARARLNSQAVAVLYLDVDNFKAINDGLGHQVGDELLQEMAARLRGCLRQQDAVARLGGDEFVLIINQVGDADAAQTVARRVLGAVVGSYRMAEKEVYASASLGVSIFPADAREAEALVQAAETAMYQAKGMGRGSFSLYTQGMNSKVRQRLSMETELRKAIVRREFLVYYQPRVCMQTGRVLGAEALVRWDRPGHGVVGPGSFIPLAEESGLIVAIGEWVLGESCRQVRQWQLEGHRDLCFSVNVSTRQLLWQHDVVNRVEQALTECGLDPSCLEVEVTESAVMHNREGALNTMQRLKEMGVRLAMDDFGTGYSSLDYLRHFPVDTLKIDRSFVSGLPSQASDVAIVSGVLSLAHSLGLCVVAEGVETPEQLEMLRGRRCHQLQGFLFSRPLPGKEMGELLASGRTLEFASS